MSEERYAQAGDVRLCYETIGDAGAPVMVLIMGLGFQLIHWPDALCRRLAAAAPPPRRSPARAWS